MKEPIYSVTDTSQWYQLHFLTDFYLRPAQKAAPDPALRDQPNAPPLSVLCFIFVFLNNEMSDMPPTQ